MTNAEKFQKVFGYYATEMWAKPEKEFLEWINEEALEQEPSIRCKDCRHIELKDFVRATCKYRTGEVMPDSYCEKGRTK